MQNQITLDAQLTDDARVVSPKFTTANALIVSTDSEGRTSKAWIDCVAFNGKSTALGQLKKGIPVKLTGRLDSNRRERDGRSFWQLRFVVESVAQGAPQP